MSLLGGLAAGCGGMDGDASDPAAAADVTAKSAALARAGADLAEGDTKPVVTKSPTKVIATQLVSDLRLDGVMSFYNHDSATDRVQINVTNIGSMPAWAPAGTVTINGAAWDGSLNQYYGGTALPGSNFLNPGERGYILVSVASGTLAPCAKYSVHIDTGRNMQAGLPDPYANDEAIVASECLSWTSTIDGNNFPIAGPPLEGSSLARVIGSFDIGRLDGLRCSACHYEGAARSYRPPVAYLGSAVIRPDQVIGGLTWAQPNGWADKFLKRPTDDSLGSKPWHLKILVQTWIDDGRNPGNMIYPDVTTTDSPAILGN